MTTMSTTSTNSTRSISFTQTAGVAAALAGAIFIAVQINHPPLTLHTATTTEWVVRSTAKTVMAVLALVGIAGIWRHQRATAGRLGTIGWVVFTIGYLGMLTTEAVAGYVLPTLTSSDPNYVTDFLTAAGGGSPKGDVGVMQLVFNIAGAGYILGGLLLGISIVRAHVLPRWAGILLAASTAATVSLKFLPDGFNRPLAVPEGIALIWLGVALSRHRATQNPTRR